MSLNLSIPVLNNLNENLIIDCMWSYNCSSSFSLSHYIHVHLYILCWFSRFSENNHRISDPMQTYKFYYRLHIVFPAYMLYTHESNRFPFISSHILCCTSFMYRVCVFVWIKGQELIDLNFSSRFVHFFYSSYPCLNI